MKLYTFNPITLEYICEILAQPNPLKEGSFFVALNSTQIEPPQVNVNEVAVFDNGKKDNSAYNGIGDKELVPDAKWEILKDFRGTTYFDVEGREYTISKIDEEVDFTKFLTKEELLRKKVSESVFNFTTRVWDINVYDLKVSIIKKISAYRYDLQESCVVVNDMFSTKTAQYNYNLHLEAISMFEAGIPVRWRNLDTKRINIDNENLPMLKDLLYRVRVQYQKLFNAAEILEDEIIAELDISKLVSYDIKAKFTAAMDTLTY